MARNACSTVLALSIGLWGAGCAKPPVAQKPVVRPVKIFAIGSHDPVDVREYPGTIQAFQDARMGFEVAGRVDEFLVQEGDLVEKNAELARLDARDYEADLKVAQANLAKAEADLKRSLSIRAEQAGAISAAQIEQDQRAVAVMQAQLEISQKAVEDTVLRAPFAGQVARKLVADFANVQAKDPVLILQDTSVLEIQVDVPERDVVNRPGTPVSKEELTARVSPKVMISALGDREFDAWIKEFATTAEPVTRTFAITMNFNRPDNANILPGMTARVRIVRNPERAWSVPSTAVQADERGGAYVWKVDSKSMTVHRIPVELGPLIGDRVRLAGGVENGDMIAVSGVTQLREGMRIREYESQP
jgi:RND family efflux transporter MFP subunit